MAYSYKNKNGKHVSGAAAYNHFIKENGGWESHNRKMAMFGAEHATELLPLAKILLQPVKKGLPKLFSKKKK